MLRLVTIFWLHNTLSEMWHNWDDVHVLCSLRLQQTPDLVNNRKDFLKILQSIFECSQLQPWSMGLRVADGVGELRMTDTQTPLWRIGRFVYNVELTLCIPSAHTALILMSLFIMTWWFLFCFLFFISSQSCPVWGGQWTMGSLGRWTWNVRSHRHRCELETLQ